MLSKLLKYDFKSVKRFGLPAVIALAILTLASGGVAYLYVTMCQNLADSGNDTAYALSSIGGVLLLIGVITLIYVAMIGIIVVIMVDFYKTTATDEAYLTFTLPTKPGQIIKSKLINAYLWELVIMILVFMVIFSLMIGVISAAASSSDEPVDAMMYAMKPGVPVTVLFGGTLGILLGVVYVLAGIANGLLMYFMAIFLGSVIAKKHKVLASIGCIFGITTLNSIVVSVGQVIVSLVSVGVLGAYEATGSAEDIMWVQCIIIGAQVLYYTGTSVLYYLILKHLMEKKLNLA